MNIKPGQKFATSMWFRNYFAIHILVLIIIDYLSHQSFCERIFIFS